MAWVPDPVVEPPPIAKQKQVRHIINVEKSYLKMQDSSQLFSILDQLMRFFYGKPHSECYGRAQSINKERGTYVIVNIPQKIWDSSKFYRLHGGKTTLQDDIESVTRHARSRDMVVKINFI